MVPLATFTLEYIASVGLRLVQTERRSVASV
jgi:hypothetical protein